MSNPRCLLAIFAHPDDEAFSMAGTFRKYSDEGVTTALICATKGEAGTIKNPQFDTAEPLGQVRERELREACELLGITDLTFLGYKDGALEQVDPEEAERRIVYHIRRLRPQVVVTFDEIGVYGHPDHIAIHRLTASAFRKAGDPRCWTDQLRAGLPPHAPAKLYWNVLPRSVLLKLQQLQQNGGIQAIPGGNAGLVPIEQMGTPDEEITTRIELDDRQFHVKMEAIRAHRTQMDPHASFNRAPLERVRQRLGLESFKLVVPNMNGVREQDLFTGIV